MSLIQARSKTIVIVAAVASNSVIGRDGGIPWHIPEDFQHFKRATLHHTLLMGRTTFESIGRPLPGRETIVLTRNRAWTHPGVQVAHDLQDAIDLAEDMPGDLMVVGGSHIYAATLSIASMQVISRIHSSPDGDACYPPWDPKQWVLSDREVHRDFEVEYWTRGPREERVCIFQLSQAAVNGWWGTDWADRLSRAVAHQRRSAKDSGAVDWEAVHEAAMRVIVEAAEDQLKRGNNSSPEGARRVRLSSHLSLQDLNAVQGALLHWGAFIAPRVR